MATIRTLVMIGVAALAGLMLAVAPGQAQSEPAGATAAAPLELTPTIRRHRTHHDRRSNSRKHHRTTRRHASPPTQTAAQNQDDNKGQEQGTVITVPAGVSLTSLLPWWRSTETQTAQHRDRAAASPVQSAADAWFKALGVEKTIPVENDYALGSANELNEMDVVADGIAVADASEFNAIDQAADKAEPQDKPQNKSWLNILLASLGGALAVASTVRYLFV